MMSVKGVTRCDKQVLSVIHGGEYPMIIRERVMGFGDASTNDLEEPFLKIFREVRRGC